METVHVALKYIVPEQSQNFLIYKTWLLGENLVQCLTLEQIWKSLLRSLSYQFDVSSRIFLISNTKILSESKNTGGICWQNMHLSIENA